MLNLRGIYSPEETYNPEDVFLWNGEAYKVTAVPVEPMHLQNCIKLSEETADCAQMIISYHPPAEAPKEETTVKPATKSTRRKKEE